jgi:hypothetical protein
MVPEMTTNPPILVTRHNFDLRTILEMMDAVFYQWKAIVGLP